MTGVGDVEVAPARARRVGELDLQDAAAERPLNAGIGRLGDGRDRAVG